MRRAAELRAGGTARTPDFDPPWRRQLSRTGLDELGRGPGVLRSGAQYHAFNLREVPHFLIHRARYEEALEAAHSLTASAYPQSRSVGHALAGQALLGLGRLDAAKGELEAAQRELQAVPQLTLGLVPRRSLVEPWVEALRGEFLLRTGRSDEGRPLLKDIARALRALPGPDAWTQALFRLESMARTARDAGDWDLA